MTALKRLSLNSLWLLLARVGAQGLSLVFVALLARRLGAATFGQFSVLAAIVFMGNVFTTFGTDTFLIRQTAQTGRPAPLTLAALWLQLGLSLLWLVGTLVAALILKPAKDLLAAISIYTLSLFPLAFYSVYSALLRGFERMDLFLLLNLLNVSLQVGVAGLVVNGQGDLLWLCLGLTGVQIVLAVVALWLCVTHLLNFKIEAVILPTALMTIGRRVWPLALLSFVGILSQRLSVLLLPVLAGAEATGFFSAAARLVEGLKLGHLAILGALLPAMSQPPTLEVKRLFQRSLVVMLIVAFGLAGLVAGLAGPIVSVLYGARYSGAVSVLAVLVWLLVPYTVDAYCSLALVAWAKEKLVLLGVSAGLLIALATQLACVPGWGSLGAAWAVVLAQSIQAAIFAVLYFFNRRHVIT